eukprot:3343427-Prymnesium_polylepis.1
MELSWFSVAEMPRGIRVHTVEDDHVIFGLDETFIHGRRRRWPGTCARRAHGALQPGTPCLDGGAL